MTSHPVRRARATRIRTDLIAIMAVVLFASIFPVNLVPSAPNEHRGTDGQFSGKQGEVLLVTVPGDGDRAEVVGQFLGRRVLFFPDSGSRYATLLGIDMQDGPGTHELTVEVRHPAGSRRLSYNVLVMKEKYPLQHLTLPKGMVDLNEDNLVRVKAEQEQVRSVLGAVSPDRYWNGRFIEPVSGQVTGAFGRVRIINGQSRSPHNGEDITAPLGTAVVAANDGIARLTADHFFSGKAVYLDHGLGLYSMYFHLSEVTVKDGEAIKRGQVIGRVGESGRATGPHLHWAIRLNGARVDPYSLVKLPLDSITTATR